MKNQLLTLFALLAMSSTFANNILVTNSSLSGQNTTNHTITINFDVSWENSWRTSTSESNYDGAWIFVKFRKNGTTAWQHCHVSSQVANASATMTGVSDNMGVFIYSGSNNIGNVNYTGNQLTWNYGSDGVLDTDLVEIKVFGMEMVYIPTGSYYLGSGGAEANSFKQGSTNEPYLVGSAGAISTGTSGTVLNFNNLGSATNNLIPSTFPNGYNAYWVMKYECTQQQYTDFLNHVTEQESAVLVQGNTGTNAIYGTTTWPNFIPTTPEQAYNNMNKAKFLAITDWSGLRPMSEMEFEKTCRGVNISPVANEYAWGNTNLTNLSQESQIEFAQTANESIVNNLQVNSLTNGSVNRPVRVGIFARPSGSTRLLSGATYYGVMNMSDNLHEFVVYAGNASGQAIDSSVHGNGSLSSDGSGTTDVAAWIPGALGVRGSYYDGNINLARVSDRQNADYSNTGNIPAFGIRMVRTAP